MIFIRKHQISYDKLILLRETRITFSEIKLSSTPLFNVVVRDKLADAKVHFDTSIHVLSR